MFKKGNKTLKPFLKGHIPWNFKGISSLNKLERDRFQREVQKTVFERDNYKCQLCRKEGYLHVEHIKEWSKFPKLRFNLNNLRTLCRECHYFVTFGKQISQNNRWGIVSYID